MICRFGRSIGSKQLGGSKVGDVSKLTMASRRIVQRCRKVSAPLLVRLSNYRPLPEGFLRHANRALDYQGLIAIA